MAGCQIRRQEPRERNEQQRETDLRYAGSRQADAQLLPAVLDVGIGSTPDRPEHVTNPPKQCGLETHRKKHHRRDQKELREEYRDIVAWKHDQSTRPDRYAPGDPEDQLVHPEYRRQEKPDQPDTAECLRREAGEMAQGHTHGVSEHPPPASHPAVRTVIGVLGGHDPRDALVGGVEMDPGSSAVVVPGEERSTNRRRQDRS